jgi:uncharacterized Tic20 family protein
VIVAEVSMDTLTERRWGMAAHLSALAGLAFGGITWLGPLAIFLWKKDAPSVREHARQALNFNLTLFAFEVAVFVLFVLAMPLWSFFPVQLLVLAIVAANMLWLIQTVRATIRANEGHAFRYRLAFSFVR